MWLSKEFGIAEWSSVQDKFEDLYIRLGAPKGMMLVCEDTEPPEKTTIFMALPDEKLAGLFSGFEETARLPVGPSFLVGDQIEMEAQFGRPGSR